MIIERNMKIHQESVEVLDAYAKHLKNLTPEDRYTRFCYNVKDEAIDQLILQILYNRNEHYLFSAVIDDQRVGFVHIAKEGADWELAVSVDKEYQAQGIANKLMDHAIVWGKTHGIHAVYMHCITQNSKIQHLARKHGLKTVERDGTEVTSKVELPSPTPMDYTSQFLHEQQQILEQIVNLQRRMIKNLNPVTYTQEHNIT